MTRLSRTLARARAEGRVALFPYLTAGFPNEAACEEILVAAAESGADGLEIGIPFSDPLADGVTIQRSSQSALSQGSTLGSALAMAGRLNSRLNVPLVFMSYLNPLLAFGFERFVEAAAGAGVDALIVPDVPPEEAEPFRVACRAANISYIYMLAPTSTLARMQAIGATASGFIYCVALVGVTGARANVSADVGSFLARVREVTNVPLLVGFGVSTPEHVRALREVGADAVVVGSAFVETIERSAPEDRLATIRQYIEDLKQASGTVAAR